MWNFFLPYNAFSLLSRFLSHTRCLLLASYFIWRKLWKDRSWIPLKTYLLNFFIPHNFFINTLSSDHITLFKYHAPLFFKKRPYYHEYFISTIFYFIFKEKIVSHSCLWKVNFSCLLSHFLSQKFYEISIIFYLNWAEFCWPWTRKKLIYYVYFQRKTNKWPK